MRHWCLLIVLFLVTGCSSEKPPPVYIGHIASLTGPDQDLGESAVRGVRLAVEQANKDKDLATQRPIAILHANAPKVNSFAVETVRLAQVNQVAALLGGWSAQQASGLDNQELSAVAPAGARLPVKKSSVFLTGLTPERKGEILARVISEHFAHKNAVGWAEAVGQLATSPGIFSRMTSLAIRQAQLKPLRVAVLVDQRQPEHSSAASSFIREMRKRWSSSERLAPLLPFRYTSDMEMHDLLKRPDTRQAQTLFLAGNENAIWKLGLKIKNESPLVLFAGPESARQRLVMNTQSSAVVWLVTAWHAQINTPQNKSFTERYRKLYGEWPNVHAALAYDNASLLFKAVQNCADTYLPGDVSKHLKKLKEFTALSGKSVIDEHGVLQRPAFAVRLQGGRIQRVRRFDIESKK